jgi:hypothetical protein
MVNVYVIWGTYLDLSENILLLRGLVVLDLGEVDQALLQGVDVEECEQDRVDETVEFVMLVV